MAEGRLIAITLAVVFIVGVSKLRGSEYWTDEQIKQQVQEKLTTTCKSKLEQANAYKNEVNETLLELERVYSDGLLSHEDYTLTKDYLYSELDYADWFARRWMTQCEAEKSREQYYQVPKGLKQLQ